MAVDRHGERTFGTYPLHGDWIAEMLLVGDPGALGDLRGVGEEMDMFSKSSLSRRGEGATREGLKGQLEKVPNTLRLSYPDETPTTALLTNPIRR